MAGKLDLDLGEDYAFDIRRAREVAEGVVAPSGPFVKGPYTSEHGTVPYFIQKDRNEDWWIWFDIDADPDPDVRTRLRAFLRNVGIVLALRKDVQVVAESLGWEG